MELPSIYLVNSILKRSYMLDICIRLKHSKSMFLLFYSHCSRTERLKKSINNQMSLVAFCTFENKKPLQT